MSGLQSILLCNVPDAAFLPVGISAELIGSKLNKPPQINQWTLCEAANCYK